MISERDTAIFYTCGTCNLQCRYCGIDKNPILIEIDKALEKSFEGDYYFERVKKYFPNRGQLVHIETWGGEPFLHMDRIYPTLHKIITNYPNFATMFSSTNFSFPGWIDQFLNLLKEFGKYPDRQFYYGLQLSCDGPEYINDAGRGQGVTKKCLKNLNEMLERLKNELPENVHLTFSTKPTLDIETIKDLCDKQKLIEYYQFFEEEFVSKINNLNMPNVEMNPGIPNTAVPAPTTKQDGKIFAEFCRICREIERENSVYHYFNYFTEITPFTIDWCNHELTYKYSHHTCGTGVSMVGFLPDNMLATCHEGFTYFAEEYKKVAASSKRIENSTITFDNFIDEQKLRYCVDDEGFIEHERQMAFYNQEGTSARLANITALIVALAMSGQIDEKYLDNVNALIAGIFIQSHMPYCIKDNYNKTGSFTLVPIGDIKLFLNGAIDYIMGEDELRC